MAMGFEGGSRPSEGGLGSPTPPQPPSWIHPDPPLLPYGRAGGLVRMQRGVKAPRGGSGFTDPPSTPLVDPPRPLHYCTSYRLIGRGLAENQRGVKAPRGLRRSQLRDKASHVLIIHNHGFAGAPLALNTLPTKWLFSPVHSCKARRIMQFPYTAEPQPTRRSSSPRRRLRT